MTLLITARNHQKPTATSQVKVVARSARGITEKEHNLSSGKPSQVTVTGKGRSKIRQIEVLCLDPIYVVFPCS